ncbi:MAG: hypothetical protein M1835_006038 [Candelina submexicana]|nr:MAG: hypothetical protein M1835_006038 [Candelina submexicana]
MPAPETFFNIAAQDSITPVSVAVRSLTKFNQIPDPKRAIQDINIDHRDVSFDFNRTVRNTHTRVEGKYVGNFTSLAQQNVIYFLHLQGQFISKGQQQTYGNGANRGEIVVADLSEGDGKLPGDGVWIGTNPVDLNLGLFVRPLPGQRITFGILESAIEALQDLGRSVSLPPFTAEDIPVYAGRPFTFDIHDEPWGHIAQAVVTECDGGVLHCFAPWGMENV